MFSMVTLGADGWEPICFLQVLQNAVCCCATLCLISLKMHKQQKEWPQSERVTGLQKRSRQMPQTMSASVPGGPSDVIRGSAVFVAPESSDVIRGSAVFVAPESTPGMLKPAFLSCFYRDQAFLLDVMPVCCFLRSPRGAAGSQEQSGQQKRGRRWLQPRSSTGCIPSACSVCAFDLHVGA